MEILRQPSFTELLGLHVLRVGALWAQNTKRRGFVLHALRFIVQGDVNSTPAALAEVRSVAVAVAFTFRP